MEVCVCVDVSLIISIALHLVQCTMWCLPDYLGICWTCTTHIYTVLSTHMSIAHEILYANVHILRRCEQFIVDVMFGTININVLCYSSPMVSFFLSRSLLYISAQTINIRNWSNIWMHKKQQRAILQCKKFIHFQILFGVDHNNHNNSIRIAIKADENCRAYNKVKWIHIELDLSGSST